MLDKKKQNMAVLKVRDRGYVVTGPYVPRICMHIMQQAIDLVQQAIEADKNQKYEEALKYYKLATVYFRNALICKRLSATLGEVKSLVCYSRYNDFIAQTAENHSDKKRKLAESRLAECWGRAKELKSLKQETRTIATDGGEASIKFKNKR